MEASDERLEFVAKSRFDDIDERLDGFDGFQRSLKDIVERLDGFDGVQRSLEDIDVRLDGFDEILHSLEDTAWLTPHTAVDGKAATVYGIGFDPGVTNAQFEVSDTADNVKAMIHDKGATGATEVGIGFGTDVHLSDLDSNVRVEIDEERRGRSIGGVDGKAATQHDMMTTAGETNTLVLVSDSADNVNAKIQDKLETDVPELTTPERPEVVESIALLLAQLG